MTKLSKFIKTPRIFIKDALKKRKKGASLKFGKKTAVSEVKKQIKEIKMVEHCFLSNKLHLVIIDNVLCTHPFKLDLIKYQFRSIEKYTNFSSLSYISEHIAQKPEGVKIYKNYFSFYNDRIIDLAPNIENFLFIDLNFLFLKEVSFKDFTGEKGLPLTFFRPSSGSDKKILGIMRDIFPSLQINFLPAMRYCCTNNINLTHFQKMTTKLERIDDYLFDLLPVLNIINSGEHNLRKNPLQFAYLDRGYIEKFLWLQAVHGSKVCPVAVNFKQMNDNYREYELFLKNIVPHQSIYEKSFDLHETKSNKINLAS